MRGLWQIWRDRQARLAAAEQLFDAIVTRAREPVFYAGFGVADTVDGRFDLIALHTYLVMRRLRDAGSPGQTTAQLLFDRLMGDWDGNLREMGVSDVGVPKKVKRMARAYYGRVEAYETGLAALPDRQALQTALVRNVYRGDAPPEPVQTAFADYVVANRDALLRQDTADLMRGAVAFTAVPAAPSGAGDTAA